MPPRYFPVTASDGTVLRAWRTGSSSRGNSSRRTPEPPVVMSNGLGAPPVAWPGITDDDSGFDVVGWWHRGLGGSERPADPARISVADHADDLCAVMDAAGVEQAVVVGWSMGVNVAFEVALREPERVAGILAVAGVPGDTFGGLFEPLLLPKALRRPAGRLGAKVLGKVGPVVRLVARGLPQHDLLHPTFGPAAHRLRHTGAMVQTLREFSRHDWPWYSQLVKAIDAHDVLDVATVRCPVTFVAGTYDMLASTSDMRRAHDRLPRSRFVELPGSHYLPLEYPGVLRRELTRLVRSSVPGQVGA